MSLTFALHSAEGILVDSVIFHNCFIMLFFNILDNELASSQPMSDSKSSAVGRSSPSSSVASWLHSLDTSGSSDKSASTSSNQEPTYEIPWNKFPPRLIEACKKKQRPEPSLRREMIRILVDNINTPGVKLPRKKQLSLLAKEIVDKYPQSFEDTTTDGSHRVGSGYDSLTQQLVNKVDNLTRPNTVKRKLSSDAMATKKVKRADTYGCINWMPDYDEGQSEQTDKQLMEEMKKAKKDNSSTVNVEDTMKKTFVTQRKQINSTEFTMEQMKQDWPYLFDDKYMLQHFQLLTGVNIQDMMEKAYGSKVSKLIAFFPAQESTKPSVDKIDTAITKTDDETPKVVGIVECLCKYFSEDFETGVLSTKVR